MKVRKDVLEVRDIALAKGFWLWRARQVEKGDRMANHHRSRGWLLWRTTEGGWMKYRTDMWFPSLAKVKQYLELEEVRDEKAKKME